MFQDAYNNTQCVATVEEVKANHSVYKCEYFFILSDFENIQKHLKQIFIAIAYFVYINVLFKHRSTKNFQYTVKY